MMDNLEKNDFAKNLRLLCKSHHSIAQVCRDIGINRQQFNRYLNAGGMPSAHNLYRIARQFSISEEELIQPHDIFRMNYTPDLSREIHEPLRHLVDAFKSQSTPLRRYLGFYYSHFCTPSWPGKIMRSLMWLRAEEGYVVSHNYEQAYDNAENIRQKTRYAGLAAYRGGRIYLVERAFSEDGFLSESIMHPAHRQQVQYLRGITMGVATRPRLEAYTSPSIWKKIPGRITSREALSGTGVFDTNSTQIDPVIREYLS